MTRPVLHVWSYGLTAWSLFAVFLVLAVFINEILIYPLNSLKWPAMPSSRSYDPEKEQTLLLVSDPQIQGYQDEHIFPLGLLDRWDADRFISKTFGMAYDYAKPDVVIFLGDLMDEGSRATESEYESTLHRFHSVFAAAKNTKKIYVSGDNDIGGEGRDIRTTRKVQRFEKHFENVTGVVKFGFIDFVKLDLKNYALTPEKVENAKIIKRKLTSPIQIALNHETLLSGLKEFIYPVIKHIRPGLVFSGHWHRSGMWKCSDCMRSDGFSWNVKMQYLSDVNIYLDFNINSADSVLELMIPTCSYRMGTKQMGYGVAVVGRDYNVKYTVLWLPRRYFALWSYLLITVAFMVYQLLVYMYMYIRGRWCR